MEHLFVERQYSSLRTVQFLNKCRESERSQEQNFIKTSISPLRQQFSVAPIHSHVYLSPWQDPYVLQDLDSHSNLRCSRHQATTAKVPTPQHPYSILPPRQQDQQPSVRPAGSVPSPSPSPGPCTPTHCVRCLEYIMNTKIKVKLRQPIVINCFCSCLPPSSSSFRVILNINETMTYINHTTADRPTDRPSPDAVQWPQSGRLVRAKESSQTTTTTATEEWKIVLNTSGDRRRRRCFWGAKE